MDNFGTFLKNYSPCNGHSKLFMLPFRDKGVILMLNLVTHQAQILDLVVHLWVKGVFLKKRLRKGCDFSHNKGFYLSNPPGD